MTAKRTPALDTRGASNTPRLYDNKALAALILPLICEQIFTAFMGTADSMMVSNVGAAAISAVSLVDSINILVIQAFYALASGGAIVCANFLGQGRRDRAEASANQLLFVIFYISIAITLLCLLFRKPLLRLVFGAVEPDVMEAALTYFFYTSLSFPFIALFDSGSSVFRAQNNSRLPMTVTILTNIMNIIGNAILIWGFGLGVAGAAISTLLSRISAALSVLFFLRRPLPAKTGGIRIGNFLWVRPEGRLIRNILRIGIPSGVENGMFQFGKLAIQSSVSTLGTAAIAAQAITNILENFNGIAGVGIGIGMIFKARATSGGSDIISMILNKYTHISLGTLVIIVDCTITLSTVIAFGDWRLPMYSWIIVFIEGKVIDLIVEGASVNKTLMIITSQTETVKNIILRDINRGATILSAIGAYQGVEHKIIYTILSRKEMMVLRHRIREIDPEAFINVIDSREILGRGFKSLQD